MTYHGLNNAQLSEAEGFLMDCFEDIPEDLTDLEIVEAIQRHYCGGVAQFLADTAMLAD